MQHHFRSACNQNLGIDKPAHLKFVKVNQINFKYWDGNGFNLGLILAGSDLYWLMQIDANRFWLVLIYAYWFWLLLIGAACCWLILIYSDSSGWCNIPPNRWNRHLFYVFITFVWILSQFWIFAHFGQFLARFTKSNRLKFKVIF